MADPYVTDQELLKLVQAARLPADVAIRLGILLRSAGTGSVGPAGPVGADGATGPAGPAPSGTGFVRVTGGVLDAAQTPTQVTAALDAFSAGSFT